MRRCSIAFCLVALLATTAPAHSAETTLAVIVHRDSTVQLTRHELVRIYLKQRRFWDDGSPIVALNRESGSRERESFSVAVLGSESRSLAAYWNQQYFQGVFPPATLSSGAAVKRYVATNYGAIGYIDAADVDASVRVVFRVRAP